MKKIYKLHFYLIIFIALFSCDDQTQHDFIKAYVTLQGIDKVAVVNITDSKVIRYVDVDFTNTADMPHYIVIDETHNYWYCTLISSGYIVKFNLQTDALIDSLYIGNMPALMEMDEMREYIYVSRFMPMMGMSTASQQVHKIDAKNMEIVGVVEVGADSPHGIALTNDGETLWVASNQASHFFKIETSRFGEENYQPENFKLGSEVPGSYEINDGFYNALELELSHDDSKLFVSCSSSNEIRVFDTDTGDSLSTYSTQTMPWHFQISKDDSELFVVNRMSSSITKLNLLTHESEVISIESMDLLHGCALSGDDETLVASSSGKNKLIIYETSTPNLLKTIILSAESEIESMPTGVTVVQ